MPPDEPFALPHEETLSTARGYDGHLVHVRVDRVRLPSGRESTREVVEHPGAVAILALTERDELILVRQWRHALGGPLLELPAGTLDRDEDPTVTAERELREETGYRAATVTEQFAFYPSPGYTDERQTLFLAEGCRLTDREESQDERTEVVLVPRAEIAGLLRPGGPARDATLLIGLLWLQRS